jgi:DNA-binding sugar fermentation-stimulating protein
MDGVKGEINALKKIFPNAQIHRCNTHLEELSGKE